MADPKSTRALTKRVINIIVTRYKNTGLDKVVDNVIQLIYTKKILILSLMNNFLYLLCGTLGEWHTERIDSKVKPNKNN